MTPVSAAPAASPPGGTASHYADYSKDATLATLQSQARAQQLGLWSQPNPTPPWEYRRNGKKKSA